MKIILLAALVAAGIFVPASPAESRLNQYTTDNQTDPATAADANGNVVAVWSSYLQDGDSGGVFARRFDPNLKPLGDEFQVNTTIPGNQTEPSVAMDNAGGFVVLWHGPGPSQEDIFAQWFDPNARAIGNEFRVNDSTDGRQLYPKVAVSNTGASVFVWEDNEFFPQLDYLQILYKLYDSNGTPIKTDIANLLSQCRYPDVAIDRDGNFTIVWMQDDSWHNSNVVMVRQFNADGTPISAPCRVSTIPFNTITQPAIAMDPTGHFVVSWYGHPDGAAFNDIYARRYKIDGTPMAEQFVVNTTLAGAQQTPSVAMNSRLDFIIVWNSETEPGSSERNIFGQRFDSFSNPLGDEFQINTYMAGDQKYPDIVLTEDGKFVTAWQSNSQDGSDYGIFAEIGPKHGSADFNADGFVNFQDYSVLAREWANQQNPLQADLIDDNIIDHLDLAAFSRQWLTPSVPCGSVDINSDNTIDFHDYALWAANWLKQGPNLDGDFTADGTVDMLDLQALLLHWAQYCQ